MKQNVKLRIAKNIFKLDSICKGFIAYYQKSKFKTCGKNVSINQNCIFTYSTISIGNDVFIGANAVMQSRFGEIIIGNHIAFGPGVNIYGADHDFRKVGEWMKDLGKPSIDNVVIEDDCWIGANTIILKNVHIGRGSIIGAGTILTKNIPPYSIVYGNGKSLFIKRRFDDNEIEEHERILNIN